MCLCVCVKLKLGYIPHNYSILFSDSLGVTWWPPKVLSGQQNVPMALTFILKQRDDTCKGFS